MTEGQVTAAATFSLLLRGVERRLAGRNLLMGVDLALGSGQTAALVGANGAGKSTLVRALLDLQAIDSGLISIGGLPHTDPRARDRIAYLPERFHPVYFLRGRGFIDYTMALYGVAPSDAEVDRVCGQLGLSANALSRSVQTLSKGMSQMLGLAACLLSGRPILILDEPMSGLDPTARIRLQKALRAHREAGGTILFTTHLMADAEALADRVAVLHEGRIVADGTPAELKERFGVGDLEAMFVECVGGVDALAH